MNVHVTYVSVHMLGRGKIIADNMKGTAYYFHLKTMEEPELF